MLTTEALVSEIKEENSSQQNPAAGMGGSRVVTVLRVRETAPEAIESLTIDSALGQTTIRFRTAIPPQLVDGVA